jgi:hypothetical protein
MTGQVQLQVFYEIVIDIGLESDLQTTARKGLSSYLHRLGCLAGAILRVNDTGGLESIIHLPRNLPANRIYLTETEKINSVISSGGMTGFLATLPIMGYSGGTNFYIIELKGFGIILLLKSGEPFDQTILHGISRLNQKLAQACLASLYTVRLEATVQKRTKDLQDTNNKLTESLAKVKVLSGLVPICSGCKKIRDDKGYWNQLETYVSKHSDAVFSHGLCPVCVKRLYPAFADEEDGNKQRASGCDGDVPPEKTAK